VKILPALLLLVAGTDVPRVTGREVVVGLPCDGCEAVFQGIPDTIPSVARIAPVGEPGEPMAIRGRLTRGDGAPAPGIVIYAYHTDAKGIYPRGEGLTGMAARHGRLRSWARTDANGEYRFDTIRPASYPNTRIPAHVHLHVIEPGRTTYYIDELLFENDPFLTPEARRSQVRGRGGPGAVANPARDANGVWQSRRDIMLGAGIPGYR